MKKMTTIGIVAILIMTTVMIIPTTGATTLKILNKEPTTNTLSEDSDYVPDEFLYEFNEFIRSLNRGELTRTQVINLYDGVEYTDENGDVQKYDGARTDLLALFGTPLIHSLDVITGLKIPKGKTFLFTPEEKAMISIDNYITNYEDDNDKQTIKEKFNDAKDNEISYEDFNQIENLGFDPQTVHQQIIDEINKPENSHIKTLIENSCNALNSDDDLDFWDIVTISLIALWCVAWSGISMLPAWSPVPMAIGILVSFGVSCAISLALDEVGVTNEIADTIRSMFPETPLAGLDYEGVISFIFGAMTFVLYFLAFTSTRIVKIISGAAVFLGVLVIIPIFIDELRKKSGKSKSYVRALTGRYSAFSDMLLRLFERLTKKFALFC